jgi:hypothetical protein
MKIANDRRTIPSFAKPVYDLWNRTGRTLVIDRDSYEFTSRVNQLAYLRDCRVNVGRVGVGHGLHDHRGSTAYHDAIDIDRYSLPALNRYHESLKKSCIPRYRPPEG